MASRSVSLRVERSVPLGMYWRSSPFCQEGLNATLGGWSADTALRDLQPAASLS